MPGLCPTTARIATSAGVSRMTSNRSSTAFAVDPLVEHRLRHRIELHRRQLPRSSGPGGPATPPPGPGRSPRQPAIGQRPAPRRRLGRRGVGPSPTAPSPALACRIRTSCRVVSHASLSGNHAIPCDLSRGGGRPRSSRGCPYPSVGRSRPEPLVHGPGGVVEERCRGLLALGQVVRGGVRPAGLDQTPLEFIGQQQRRIRADAASGRHIATGRGTRSAVLPPRRFAGGGVSVRR